MVRISKGVPCRFRVDPLTCHRHPGFDRILCRFKTTAVGALPRHALARHAQDTHKTRTGHFQDISRHFQDTFKTRTRHVQDPYEKNETCLALIPDLKDDLGIVGGGGPPKVLFRSALVRVRGRLFWRARSGRLAGPQKLGFRFRLH